MKERSRTQRVYHLQKSMVKFDKLWKKLDEMGLQKRDLYHATTQIAVAKMAKNEHVSLGTIENLCKFLECTPNDIMEIDMSDMTFSSKKKGSRFKDKEIIPVRIMKEKGLLIKVDGGGKPVENSSGELKKLKSTYRNMKNNE